MNFSNDELLKGQLCTSPFIFTFYPFHLEISPRRLFHSFVVLTPVTSLGEKKATFDRKERKNNRKTSKLEERVALQTEMKSMPKAVVLTMMTRTYSKACKNKKHWSRITTLDPHLYPVEVSAVIIWTSATDTLLYDIKTMTR